MIFTLPNLLSLSRIPLAFVFLQENIPLRCMALVLAVLTDIADGYIARSYNQKSKLGALIDPLADKFFVLFVLIVLITEGRLTVLESVMMMSRDFAILLFGFYLAFYGTLKKYQFRSIWSGKVATTFQFAAILALTWRYSLPGYLYGIFVVLGFFALIELSIREHSHEAGKG